MDIADQIRAARGRVPVDPGTLWEVAAAHERLPPGERRNHTLSIGADTLNYVSAFELLRNAPDIAALPWDRRIIYGTAKVVLRGQELRFETVAWYPIDGIARPIQVTLRRDDPAVQQLMEKGTPRRCWLYWLGGAPVVAANRYSFQLQVPPHHKLYKGISLYHQTAAARPGGGS